MSLSCECNSDIDYEFNYLPPTDYDTAAEALQCRSCEQSIPTGATIATFELVTYDDNGEEQYGEDEHMCEVCADLYFSLEELGFCITLGDDMRELVEEYAEMVKHGEFQ